MTIEGLAAKRIIVGGGTGDVGVEIVASLLTAGAEVIAVVRSAARAESLGSHDRLILVEGFPEDDAGVDTLRANLASLGRIDGAVASLGPWFHGPDLAELPADDWHRMIAAGLTSHFLFARAVTPAVADTGGQYVMINGAAAHTPIPHSGVVSILARAQTMIAEVLAAENPTIGVHTLMLASMIVTRSRPAQDPSWITAIEVGDACAWLFTPQGRLTAGGTVTLHSKQRRTS